MRSFRLAWIEHVSLYNVGTHLSYPIHTYSHPVHAVMEQLDPFLSIPVEFLYDEKMREDL